MGCWLMNFSSLFALVILAFFMVSMFSVLLSVPSSGPELSPSPTVAESRFEGSGVGEGVITALSNQFFMQCKDASDSAVKAVEAVEGVSMAFKPSSDLIIAFVNVSYLNDSSNAFASKLVAAVNASCTGARVLRSAVLEFSQPIKLSALPSSAVKGDRFLYPREVTGFGLRTAGVAGAVGYVDSLAAHENRSVAASVYAVYASDRLEVLQAEEIPTIANPTSSAGVNSTDLASGGNENSSAGGANSSGAGGVDSSVSGGNENSSAGGANSTNSSGAPAAGGNSTG